MIPLTLSASAEGERAYVARLRAGPTAYGPNDALALRSEEHSGLFAGPNGLLEIAGINASALDGDVVLIDPRAGRAERLLRPGSTTNTLLITERCDQLCVMCSQPPKKTHVDRFALLEEACLLAPDGMLIGISGGEPTLYKEQLLSLIERVHAARNDLGFHVLTNAQHFEDTDIARLAGPAFRKVSWGIPLYASDPNLHDQIVGKSGAFARLEASLARLAMAGARVELRTVVLTDNVSTLPKLARYVSTRLRFIEAWSIMQLEHIGFAKNRWSQLFYNHSRDFTTIAAALDHALLRGVGAQLFNFPRCTVPAAYRSLAIASISDWKRKFAPACNTCSDRNACSGFFEWHPDEEARMAANPL